VTRAVASTVSPEYRAAYEKGWRSSASTAELDDAEDRYLRRYGKAQIEAWTDGWYDMAAGREKWHLTNCTGCEEHPQPPIGEEPTL
jgi:hypothetical protein